MSVTLSDEHYGAMMRALTFIARGWKISRGGFRQRISRDEMTNEAREACSAAKIKWEGIPLRPDAQSSHPQEKA